MLSSVYITLVLGKLCHAKQWSTSYITPVIIFVNCQKGRVFLPCKAMAHTLLKFFKSARAHVVQRLYYTCAWKTLLCKAMVHKFPYTSNYLIVNCQKGRVSLPCKAMAHTHKLSSTTLNLMTCTVCPVCLIF